MRPDKIPQFDVGRYSAVAIGSSTGGPGLVEKIITGLPADLGVPIFIAQHMPPQFTHAFAHQLDVGGAMTAVHAEDGMPVYPGTAYVGVGQKHMRVRKVGGSVVRVVISHSPAELLYKPSADELFKSCAQVYGRRVLAVVMTGIGRDGTEGAGLIKAAGGTVLTQNKETCAVYGMPRSCDQAGVSDASLTPDQIRRAILQLSPQHGHTAAVS